MTFEFEESGSLAADIKVIGVGGGGGNAVDNMIISGLEGVDFIGNTLTLHGGEFEIEVVFINLSENEANPTGQSGSRQIDGVRAGNIRAVAIVDWRQAGAAERVVAGDAIVTVVTGFTPCPAPLNAKFAGGFPFNFNDLGFNHNLFYRFIECS